MKLPNFSAMTPVVAKAIEEMMAKQGEKFSLEKINLAELERRTGISRAKLRRMKKHDFEDTEHASKGRKASTTVLSGYTGILDNLLKDGVKILLCASTSFARTDIPAARPRSRTTSWHTSTSFRLPVMRLLRKETEGGATPLALVRHFRWTGALPR